MPAHEYTARYVKVCVVCKTEFPAKQERTKCCSLACQQSWSRRKPDGQVFKRGTIEKTCIVCNSVFMALSSVSRFCSKSCCDAFRRRGKDNPKLHEPIMQRNHWHPVIDGMRKCAVCGEVKPVAEYYSIAHSKKLTTYLHGICKSCDLQGLRARTHNRTSEQRQAQRARTAQKNGKVYIPGGLAARREYNKLNNQERFDRAKSIKEARAAWKEWISIRAPKQWLDEYWANHPKPWNDPRLDEKNKWKLKYNNDKEFHIKSKIRLQIRTYLRRYNGDETTDCEYVKSLAGIDIKELSLHLEKQFTKGMTWEKFFNGEIHIDHIIPTSSFDFSNPDDVLACWSLSNLRPMWAKENIAKGNKILFLL